MKRSLVVIGIFLLVLSCGRTEQRIWVPTDYRTWDKTVDEVLSYPIAGHGPTYRIIYINKAGEQATETVRDGKEYYEYPPGTIIIKEIYKDWTAVDAKSPFQLTVMIKEPDAEEAVDGWVWVVKDTETAGETVFRSIFCADCHGDANERHRLGKGNPDGAFRDYVFFPYRDYAGSKERGESGAEY